MQKLIIVALLLFLVIAALIIERTLQDQHSTTSGGPPHLSQQTVLSAGNEQTFKLNIRQDMNFFDAANFQVKQNNAVLLRVVSDTSGQLTIDKYSPVFSLEKNKEGSFSFTANHIGSFIIRFSGKPVGILFVNPQ